ncbi:MAG: ABC transporter permease [Chitinophagales bacterium]
MFDFDKWQEIFSIIQKHKLRTAATAFGVFWGILMLIILLGAGQGLQNGVMKDMVLDATNSIWFFTGRTSLPYNGMQPGRELKFTEEDLLAVEEQIEGIEFIAPENFLAGSFNIVKGTKSAPFMVLGAGKDYFNIKVHQEYLKGRKLNFNDNLGSRKVCVIGDRVSEVLFEEDENPIGAYIDIKGVAFKIVGLFHDDGWGGRFSERIYTPFSTFQQTFNPSKSVRLFAVTTKEGTSGGELEDRVLTLLRQRHTVSPDDNQAFWTHNQEDNFNQITNLFLGIKSFIWLVGIGTLIAGIVGISNIMIIVVKERTREIGVRKAMGATPNSIVGLILQESILITSIAGYLGVLVGVGLLEGLNYVLTLAGEGVPYFANPQVDFPVVIAAVIVLILAGTLAGLFPAMRAARIKPVEALKG